MSHAKYGFCKDVTATRRAPATRRAAAATQAAAAATIAAATAAQGRGGGQPPQGVGGKASVVGDGAVRPGEVGAGRVGPGGPRRRRRGCRRGKTDDGPRRVLSRVKRLGHVRRTATRRREIPRSDKEGRSK